jgi:protein-ribulosamine 3-kinase
MSSDLNIIAKAVSTATGGPFHPTRQQHVGGGCINDAVVLMADDGQKYFVKLNNASRLDMFVAEATGLEEIVQSGSLRAPRPVCTGIAGGEAFLVLEHLPLGGHGNEAALGSGLAAMHRTTREQFGWRRDNTIGSTTQVNTHEDDWVEFYREHRLRFQLELAAENGDRRLLREGESLLDALPAFFTNYQPQASLLHGDLWGGNRGALPDGTPVIFDPAVYYGDREADLAMTELFGGFGARFYAAYNEAWPLDGGYRVRRELYNLYHILNHYNLFGGGYASQAMRMMQSLMSQVR